MLRLAQRTGLALAVMVIGLLLWGAGVSVGAWITLIGIVAAFVVNLLAPLPGSKRWQEWSRSKPN
jgi:hypothetical protein